MLLLFRTKFRNFKLDISTEEVLHLFKKELSSTSSAVLHDSGTAGRDSSVFDSVARNNNLLLGLIKLLLLLLLLL